MSLPKITGGCQCGAVRYALQQKPSNVHICHCRMCQKAVGGPFAVICPVLKPAFQVTRGELSYFMSSGVGRRGFCRDCGTPLTFDYPDGDDIGVMVGTLDDPHHAPPENQYGNESRVQWYDQLLSVPGTSPTYENNPTMRRKIATTNRQHPDHETTAWPKTTGHSDK